LARASLNAFRRVARIREMVAGPVILTSRTVARTSGSLVFAARISALRASIWSMRCSMWCGRNLSSTM
jgi:hypothetical protein